jgi:hypothetical protein
MIAFIGVIEELLQEGIGITKCFVISMYQPMTVLVVQGGVSEIGKNRPLMNKLTLKPITFLCCCGFQYFTL